MACHYRSELVNDNYLVQIYKEKIRYEYPMSATTSIFTNDPGILHSTALIVANGTELDSGFDVRSDNAKERYSVEFTERVDGFGSGYTQTLTITGNFPWS